jgi:hypothetical protein
MASEDVLDRLADQVEDEGGVYLQDARALIAVARAARAYLYDNDAPSGPLFDALEALDAL